ncbi:radical SAM protein [Leptolyngbya iicbica LK]|uniref:Radical SAM protein n=3 Tax=Cyanophyceae TaxID=3028117 RepID=A0A4Q7E8A1_9CYAN|nr:radical SAM protein [Leptolyngbya sp. LK]
MSLSTTTSHPYLSRNLIPSRHLNLMGTIKKSEVNGPGCRAVVWVQGCARACGSCFNPASWEFEINQLVSIDQVVELILSEPSHEGVTFSGGEPFWQATALAEVARQVKAHGLNVMSFSGFTLDELQSDRAPAGAHDLLQELDLLIDGPYVESQAINDPTSLVSSRNQKVRIFNEAMRDRLNWASDQIEIHILPDGSRIVTGYLGSLNPLSAEVAE